MAEQVAVPQDEEKKKPAEPSWEQQAAEALGRLTEPHAEKKKATVLALVRARLAGTSQEAVWEMDGTCSRTVWQNKWKKDKTITGVLEDVLRLARQWNDGKAARALAQAAEALALASPTAVEKAVKLLESADESLRLKAALAILDRAGLETASKGSGALTLHTGEVLPDEEQAAVEAVLRQRASQP